MPRSLATADQRGGDLADLGHAAGRRRRPRRRRRSAPSRRSAATGLTASTWPSTAARSVSAARYRWSSQRADAVGAQPHLGRRLLAGDVERAVRVAAQPRGDVEQQRRLADAGLAGEQHDGAGHQPAAEHPVELVDAGGPRRRRLDVDLADRQRGGGDRRRPRSCGPRARRPPRPCPRPGTRRSGRPTWRSASRTRCSGRTARSRVATLGHAADARSGVRQNRGGAPHAPRSVGRRNASSTMPGGRSPRRARRSAARPGWSSTRSRASFASSSSPSSRRLDEPLVARVHGGSAPMKTLCSSSGRGTRPATRASWSRSPAPPLGRHRLERRRRPAAGALVVVMTRHALGPERQHRVGPYVGHHLGDPAYRLFLVDVGAPAVGVVEPVVLGDAELGQRRLHLRVRTAASGAPEGQRSSSGEPSSPRVAVMQTTRSPAGRRGPSARRTGQVSSSGCAQTPRMVPRGLSPLMARTLVRRGRQRDVRCPPARRDSVADHGWHDDDNCLRDQCTARRGAGLRAGRRPRCVRLSGRAARGDGWRTAALLPAGRASRGALAAVRLSAAHCRRAVPRGRACLRPRRAVPRVRRPRVPARLAGPPAGVARVRRPRPDPPGDASALRQRPGGRDRRGARRAGCRGAAQPQRRLRLLHVRDHRGLDLDREPGGCRRTARCQDAGRAERRRRARRGPGPVPEADPNHTTNPPGRETAAAAVLRDHLEAAGVSGQLVARDPTGPTWSRGSRAPAAARRWRWSGTWTSCPRTHATGPIRPSRPSSTATTSTAAVPST